MCGETAGDDGVSRCNWAGSEPIYRTYHDTEWGVPEYDSRALWEKLILDGFQAGLSWLTILKKRDNFRAAFRGFNPREIATWGEDEVDRLVQDAGIIRHRGKINATISNARAWCAIEDWIGFDTYMWRTVDFAPLQPKYTTQDQVPPSTDLSARISKQMKKDGFKFCGPTIVYAWMEACGLVNDHLTTCHRHDDVAQMARADGWKGR